MNDISLKETYKAGGIFLSQFFKNINNLKLLLLISLIIIWGITVFERAPYLGTLSEGNHQWLTSSTLKFVENWLNDGFLEDLGLMLEMPQSIEFKDLYSRDPYVSYIPGAVFQIYILKYFFQNISTLLLIQIFGVINQLLIAVLIFHVVVKIHWRDSSILLYLIAFMAGVSYLLAPDLMYWHSMLYFADQAVLLPFALILYFESCIRAEYGCARKFYILQSITISYAFVIDYLALPVAIALFIFRIITPPRGKNLPHLQRLLFNLMQLTLGIFLIITFYTFFLYEKNLLDPLIKIFFYRIGATDTTRFTNNFVWIFFGENLGIFKSIVILLTTIFFIKLFFMGGNERQLSIVPLIAILSAFLQVFMLRNHSAVHNFSAMKFYLPISIAAVGVMPYVCFNVFGLRLLPNIWNKKSKKAIFLTFYSTFFCIVIFFIHLQWESAYPQPGLANETLAVYLRHNSQFEDIFISQKEILPPHALGISMKKIYFIQNKELLKAFLSNLPSGAQINIVRKNSEACEKHFFKKRVPNTDIYIYKTNLTEVNKIAKCLFND